MYYVVKVDNNTLKLSNTYFDSTELKPIVVGITSASLGTINPINPPIELYKDSTITFDLSDSSLAYTRQGTTYSAFEFNLYTDKNFTKVWNTSGTNNTFELKNRKGRNCGSKATLTVNKNIPEILYYKLDVLIEKNVPDVPKAKGNIIVDDEIVSGSEIRIEESLYNGKHVITLGTTTSFTYTLPEVPENHHMDHLLIFHMRPIVLILMDLSLRYR